MDNKITKKRLSDFLSYEWIAVIAVAIACIIVWELIFTMTGVRLTTGQEFKFYYDQTIYADSSNKMYDVMTKDAETNKSIFSYDVLKISHETLMKEYNVLYDRLSVQEGDVIVTDCVAPAEDAEDKSVRAKTIIDGQPVYDFDTLLSDAESYLAKLLKDGLDVTTTDVCVFENLDGEKIEKLFLDRMKRDNRFRTEEAKTDGIKLEKERIQTLCDEVRKFRILLSQGEEYFFMYSRYEQVLLSELSSESAEYYQKNKDQSPKKYGLRVEALTGGIDPSELFKLQDSDNAKDVVVLVFNFLKYQPHLQFECISFLNAIVSECSNLY